MKYVLLVVIFVFLSCKKEEASGKAGSSNEDNSKEVTDTQPSEVKAEAPEAKTPEPKKVEFLKPQMSLLEAVKAGNLEEVKRNLHHNPKPVPNNEIEYKLHPLIVAVINGKEKIVREMLKVYSPDSASKDGVIPIAAAAIEKNLPMVQLLIEYKAKIDLLDPTEATALFIASARDDIEMVEYLIQKSADVNKVCQKTYDPKTALDIALQNEQWKVANYLKKKGAKQYKDLK